MAPSILKKRKHEDISTTKPLKKLRKQKTYSSSSSSAASEEGTDELPAIGLAESEEDADFLREDVDISSTTPRKSKTHSTKSPPPSTSPSNSSDSETSLPQSSRTNPNGKSTTSSKRNDPTAFASSMSAILSSKLTTQKRSDPVLARSATAQEANASIANTKLEAKAKKKMRDDKREALDKGRVRDVLLGTDRPGSSTRAEGGEGDGGAVSVGELQEQERRLRKTAQRGVVKLFNAVRAAQVKAEEAKAQGGSRGRKEERVGEMSKKGFLEMVAGGGGGGKKMDGAGIEEG